MRWLGRLFLLIVALPVGAFGDEGSDDADAEPISAASSLESGSFLPRTLSARSDGRRGFAFVEAGWNPASSGAVLDSTAETQIAGRLGMRVGATYDGATQIVGPRLELKLDVTRQERAGVNLAVAAGYEGIGFNTVPAAVARVAVGGTLGRLTLVANIAYGQGLELGERYGDLRASALHRLSRRVFVGFDSMMRLDLERDDDEPEGEMDWELRTGPAVSFAVGRVALTVGTALSAFQLRAARTVRVGPVATAGVAMVF